MSPLYLQIVRPHIIWLLEKRREMELEPSNTVDFDRRALNSAIALYSAIFIEGVCEDILCSCAHMYTKEVYGDKTSSKIAEIEKTYTLENYIKLFKEIFAKDLRAILGDVLWLDMDMIFKFRNHLSHAQRENTKTIILNDKIINILSSGYFSNLIKYLIKKKVIGNRLYNKGDHLQVIFSDKVSDWFRDKAEEISKKILIFALKYGKGDPLVQFHLKDHIHIFSLQKRTGKGIS